MLFFLDLCTGLDVTCTNRGLKQYLFCLLKHVADSTGFRLSHTVLFECFNWSFYVFLVSKCSKDSGVVNFMLSAVLGSFRVAVCDDRSNIADIRVQGRKKTKCLYIKVSIS